MTTQPAAELGAVRDTRSLYAALDEERRDRNIGPREAAIAMGMNQDALYAWSKPSRRFVPKLDTLVRLADLLDLEIHITLRRKP